MDLLSGSIFHNRYRLIRELGCGSFGEVWLAIDTLISIEVAIKIYVALDSRGVEEFMREFKNTYELNHRNLIHAHHFDVYNHRPYLVMPYCPNGSAEDLIGKVDEILIWRFIRDVASGLSYLHEQEPPLIHQDIKPANILVDSTGNFLITDFGVSKRIRNTIRKNSSEGPHAGTISYMAPERFISNPISIKANDIWSLGATIYELLTGELPFCGLGGSVLNNDGVQLPVLGNEFSYDLNNIVQSCLVKNAWERPTAKELVKFAESKIDGTEGLKPWLNRKSTSTYELQYRKTEQYKKNKISSCKTDGIYKTRHDYNSKKKISVFLIFSLLIMCGLGYYVANKISLITKDKEEYSSLIDKGFDCERMLDDIVIDTNAVYEKAIHQCDSAIEQYNKIIEQYSKAVIFETKYKNSLFYSLFEKNASYMISVTQDKINIVEKKRLIIQNNENKRILAENKRKNNSHTKPKKINNVELKPEIQIETQQNEVKQTVLENGFINGHEYVDLGLSVKWATCNVGASAPYEYGNYYSWGELEIKDNYISDSCVTYKEKIADIAGNPQYDVAQLMWGVTWRLPTESEIIELIDNCEFKWQSVNNIYGYSVKGPSGNSIFIPAAGYKGKKELYFEGKNGQYWSSTPDKKDHEYARFFFFNNAGSKSTNWGLKSLGQSVRPVSE